MSISRNRLATLLTLCVWATFSAACSSEDVSELYRAPQISNVVDGVIFEAGDWEPHLPAGSAGRSWGNHRAVVELAGMEGEPDAVFVTIPWRRHDADPGARSIVVVNAATGEPVPNSVAPRIENGSGDVIFQPVSGSTVYHVYYMPWESTGGYYPRVTYPRFDQVSDSSWERRVQAMSVADLPVAQTTRIQSVDAFHSFFPMEVIATPAETRTFMTGIEDGWALLPEHRDYPVRMRSFIPHHWAVGDRSDTLNSKVLRGEYFTFQVALVAGEQALDDVGVTFAGFPESWQNGLSCFNCGGIDENGLPFEKSISLDAGTIQPIWIGIEVPENQRAGNVTGNVTVHTRNRGNKSVTLSLEVRRGAAVNHGFNSPELMTRLGWLNSTHGTDPNFIVDPYHAIETDGKSLSILGRTVDLSASGFPRQIFSYFTPELTALADTASPLLVRPIDLELTVSGGMEVLRTSDYQVDQVARGRVEWVTENRSDRFAVRVEGALEYDGMLDYRVTVRALEDVSVNDIALPITLRSDAATYMLGLGRMGGKRPATVDWKWKVENHQEGVWLGAVNKGIQYVLRDDDYVRPLNTNFYQNQPLRMPTSWFNEGKGGMRITTSGDGVTALNYSGTRSMHVGDSLQFNIRFLLTPFKTIDTQEHFRTRFVHRYVPVDSVVAWGGTVVNVHHANEINPYINYPFYNLDLQTEYITEAHSKGIKVKLYNTIRELSYKAHELFALRSLGDEILNDGEGGGHSWMQEHLESNYHSAWHAWRVDDAAMLDKGTSRWTNYYVEGLSWLAANQHIDGLYLDDIAFSRATVKRIISVLHEHRDDVVIDLHSANQFNPRDGFINSAMLYMEHFPYISRLWFGEYFDYSQDEDYWMTEVSGLPFGLMGEMLQDGGHPYRGLLYGMTARIYGETDPRPVWRLMNEFGIDESRMLGYWLDGRPVETDNPRILATTYLRSDTALVVLASWSPADEVVHLQLDDNLFGVAPHIVAPAVEGLQDGTTIDASRVMVPANLGLYLLIDRTDVQGNPHS